ncbi:MAG: hypothetical protein ACLGI9_09725 [Thermoanaerobaculia bacterium]
MRIAVALLLVVTLASAGCALSPSGDILTWQEYDRLDVQWPYILRRASGRGELLYYGIRHTFSPDDPQIDEIEKLWTAFRPDIAFNEGGNPPIGSSREETVRKGGESAFVRFLAARDDVPVASLDPTRSEEVAHLRRRFSAEEVKLFFVLRSVAQHVNRGAETPVEKEVERVLGIHNATPGLMGRPRTLDEVASAYRQRFPGREYGDTPMSWYDPTLEDTFLNRMSRSSSEYRDRFMVEKLTSHLQEGHRVFAVVGGTHVVMQAPALRRKAARETR